MLFTNREQNSMTIVKPTTTARKHAKPIPDGYNVALAQLYGDTPNRMQHFDALSRAEKEAAVRRMADAGFSDGAIAHATKLSKEFVRSILGERGDER
jgi:hypothetical protein